MAQPNNNLEFLAPISLEELKARYGRIGVFVVTKGDGSKYRFVKKIGANGEAGMTLAFVSKSYDPNKEKQIARAIRTDANTGNMEEISILCNVGNVGELVEELQ